MIKVAVVEDDDRYAASLGEYLDRYSKDNGTPLGVTRFSEAVSFLENYRSEFSVVLMDIDLPMLSGMDAAKKLRERDKTVCLIFITNLAQFACEGYGVDALDFVVKPVSYPDFAMKFGRAVARAKAAAEREFGIPVTGGVYRVSPGDILFVEVVSHKVLYHTAEKVIESREPLASVEERLSPSGFLRVNKCYLVNPKHIVSVEGLKIDVGGEVLFMSHGRRREVLQKLASWHSGR